MPASPGLASAPTHSLWNPSCPQARGDPLLLPPVIHGTGARFHCQLLRKMITSLQSPGPYLGKQTCQWSTFDTVSGWHANAFPSLKSYLQTSLTSIHWTVFYARKWWLAGNKIQAWRGLAPHRSLNLAKKVCRQLTMSIGPSRDPFAVDLWTTWVWKFRSIYFFNKYVGKFFGNLQQFKNIFSFLYCKNVVYNTYNRQSMC